jgi:2-polyprenyl-3-methyl-5-hydroxy-6-metoxy-1,4-benzoquinol methylase
MGQTGSHQQTGALKDLVDPDKRGAVAALAEELRRGPGCYHRLDFGDGLVVDGIFDIDKYLHRYHLPRDLRGATVLDVGTASGYFALTCAARGAEVTAIDVWDALPVVDVLGAERTGIRYVQRDLYTLDEEFGTFDLVVCGSLLLHLPDPLGAIRKLRQACRGTAIISTAATEDSANDQRRRCVFVGEQVPGTEYWTYWALGASALARMCEVAGFAEVDNVDHFDLMPEPGSMPTPEGVPHVVLTATV